MLAVDDSAQGELLLGQKCLYLPPGRDLHAVLGEVRD